MDPVEVREQRVSTGSPVAPTPASEPATPDASVDAVGRRAATPATVEPATTRTYSSRSVYTSTNRVNQFIWLLAGIAGAILVLDFIFRAAGGANTGFAHYIYRLGGWLAAPFDGIFSNAIVNHTLIRWADVLALVVYTLAAFALTRLVLIMSRPRGAPIA